MATNPYLLLYMIGDLNYQKPFADFPWELCAKKTVEVSAETDTKGNASVKGEGAIKSDDNKDTFKVEVEYRKTDNGENEGRAKVTYKKEF